MPIVPLLLGGIIVYLLVAGGGKGLGFGPQSAGPSAPAPRPPPRPTPNAAPPSSSGFKSTLDEANAAVASANQWIKDGIDAYNSLSGKGGSSSKGGDSSGSSISPGAGS